MELTWQPPAEWEQAGIRITNVTGLKTSAWTLILTGKETREVKAGAKGGSGGGCCDIIIKVFNVPVDIVQDPVRIAKEREKFLAAGRLQKKLGDSGARGWVKVRALSEDATAPAYVMDKCGPSLQDFGENRAHVSANDLYVIVLAVIDALNELFVREKRSHGNLKASDILVSKVGKSTAYQLADPAAEGESHSANDLYGLGQVLFKLIEHKEYDPLVPLASTKEWDRFGARRDRWIQFCTMLLNPNGWHEGLGQVRKEAVRLKPVPRFRAAGIAAAGIVLIAAGAIMADRYLGLRAKETVVVTTGAATTIHADAKGELNAAKQAYTDLRLKYSTLINGSHYDHTKSRVLARQARDTVPDPAMIVDDAGCRAAAADYRKALEKLQGAMAIAQTEEDAGKAQEQAADAEKAAFTDARTHYMQVNDQWTKALGGASGDLTEAKGLAEQAHSALPAQMVLTDAASYDAAAKSYKEAAGKMEEALAALARAPKPPPPVVVDTGGAIAKGNDALTKQQYGEALKWYKTAADAGNAAAMCNVGLLYETGKGTAQDNGEAMSWYTKAADKNYVPGAVNLASMYERDQNYGKAFVRYKQAAELNDAGAMVRLGHFYEEGLGTEEDKAEAVKWYEKAAALNNSTAMTNLGVLYSRGYGVQLDDAEAMKWFKKGADLKNPAAMNAIGGMYDAGHGVKQDPAEAMSWYKKAAALGFAPAMTNIGTMYDNGQGVPRDSAEALNWFRKAADLGDGMGMFNTGVLYETGRGVSQNIAEALTWYRRAEKAGDPTARQSALDRIGRLGFPP